MNIVEKLTSEHLKQIGKGASATFKLPSQRAIYNAQKMCTWTRDAFPELGIEKYSTSRDKKNLTLTITAIPLNEKISRL